MRPNFNDTLEEAWNDFKGSTQNSSVSEAREILETIDTVRTYSFDGVDTIGVYLNANTDVPEILYEIIDRHNLVQTDSEHNSHHSVFYFTTQKLAETNNLEFQNEYFVK